MSGQDVAAREGRHWSGFPPEPPERNRLARDDVGQATRQAVPRRRGHPFRMRDHSRTLGALFLAYGLLQAVLAIVLGPRTPGITPGRITLLVVLALVAAAAYAWTGVHLRDRDPRARTPAIALCVLALFSFPVGTALGGYGLWVLLRRRTAAAQ
jgi:hypothetical protein